MKITTLIGVRGSGKDYTANKLAKLDKVKGLIPIFFSFSEAIRIFTFSLLGLTYIEGEAYDQFKKRSFSRNGIVKTGREWLEEVGEEVRMRNPIAWSDYIVEQFMKTGLNRYSKNVTIYFTDCRFSHEVQAIKEISRFVEGDNKFIFCDYRSERYDDADVPSNKLALDLRNRGFKDQYSITDYDKSAKRIISDLRKVRW